MALYGVETDGTILNLPIFSANWGGTKGRKTFTRGENDPAICVLEALKKVSGASLAFCSWKDDSVRPEIIYPSSDSNDIYHASSHAGGIRL